MTFTTSFIASFTLTSSLLYLTILHHRRTRAHQAALLNSQSLLLNSLVNPQLASDLAASRDANFSGWGGREKIWPISLYEVVDSQEGVRSEEVANAVSGRGDHIGLRRPLIERWKDGWNREVTGGYRWVFGGGLRNTWEDVRGGIVERLKKAEAEVEEKADKKVV